MDHCNARPTFSVQILTVDTLPLAGLRAAPTGQNCSSGAIFAIKAMRAMLEWLDQGRGMFSPEVILDSIPRPHITFVTASNPGRCSLAAVIAASPPSTTT